MPLGQLPYGPIVQTLRGKAASARDLGRLLQRKSILPETCSALITASRIFLGRLAEQFWFSADDVEYGLENDYDQASYAIPADIQKANIPASGPAVNLGA
jgi:hypothetical protein